METNSRRTFTLQVDSGSRKRWEVPLLLFFLIIIAVFSKFFLGIPVLLPLFLRRRPHRRTSTPSAARNPGDGLTHS